MWMGAAVAYRQGREVSVQATTVGLNTSHKDATFCALVDATELAKRMLATSLASSIAIYTMDHQTIPWLLTTDRHNNALECRDICKSLATTLFDHPDMTVSISWIPGTAGFLPLKRILEVATDKAAAAGPVDQCHPPPPSQPSSLP
jgi:hypothetical protein